MHGRNGQDRRECMRICGRRFARLLRGCWSDRSLPASAATTGCRLRVGQCPSPASQSVASVVLSVATTGHYAASRDQWIIVCHRWLLSLSVGGCLSHQSFCSDRSESAMYDRLLSAPAVRSLSRGTGGSIGRCGCLSPPVTVHRSRLTLSVAPVVQSPQVAFATSRSGPSFRAVVCHQRPRDLATFVESGGG
jgi:hypothetical protein